LRELAQEEITYIEPNIQLGLNQQETYEKLKRIIDFSGAICGLFFLSIVFLIVILFIKIEDPKGRAFYSQERIGKNGKRFKMYKFRSMVSNADARLIELLGQNEVKGAMFKMKNDPRITKTGRFIRKTSIDELPQLWNVVLGDMSLVGPRPPLTREVDEYTPYQKQRLLVTPGCTGLWQCTSRNSVGFEEMVELDLEYIKRRSGSFDIIIILKTILVMLNSKNAY
jgi:lipopolysaccharide/colanic/teichoic acid biosynthesis glycosyltransferase